MPMLMFFLAGLDTFLACNNLYMGEDTWPLLFGIAVIVFGAGLYQTIKGDKNE